MLFSLGWKLEDVSRDTDTALPCLAIGAMTQGHAPAFENVARPAEFEARPSVRPRGHLITITPSKRL